LVILAEINHRARVQAGKQVAGLRSFCTEMSATFLFSIDRSTHDAANGRALGQSRLDVSCIFLKFQLVNQQLPMGNFP
jgi:hypothetical protein